MQKPTSNSFIYGLAGLVCLLLSIIGYVAGHKFFTVSQLIGVGTSLWQVLVALLVISATGGIGESVLKFSELNGLIRSGLASALGMIALAAGILAWGSLLGTSPISFSVLLLAVYAIFHKNILIWIRNLGQLNTTIHGKHEKVMAAGVILILLGNLLLALAPPVEWDSLVYHYAIPSAYIKLGHIAYLPDTMFWGMPQLTEMLYLPQISLAGPQAAAVFGVLSGALAMIGILGYVKSKFSNIAAWTAIAALLSGENLAYSLSTGYVDWISIFFGWASLVALNEWIEKQDRRWLILAGIFCGGALGTKYTAGVLLIGCFFVLLIMQKQPRWKTIIFSIVILGLTATISSSAWWLKNFLGTGNPFYPFFVPAGAMDTIRLSLYQNLPAWRDWRSVILLPWQATFIGIDGKEGFAASIGALLVGLSPLVLIDWRNKEPKQKTTIQIAGIVAMIGFILWAVGSRVSGLLIQTRLYYVIFPALAVLAGAGLDAIWNLSSKGVRFGRLTWMLAMFMLGLNIFSFGSGVLTFANPAAYIFRSVDQQTYLQNRLGTYALAMESIHELSENSRVLMLWEPRGYYCQPVCDPDEIIDKWPSDSRKYADSPTITRAWKAQGYTHLLIYNTGKEFVRTEDPQGAFINWSLLDATLRNLRIEKQIESGSYTLYKLP